MAGGVKMLGFKIISRKVYNRKRKQLVDLIDKNNNLNIELYRLEKEIQFIKKYYCEKCIKHICNKRSLK